MIAGMKSSGLQEYHDNAKLEVAAADLINSNDPSKRLSVMDLGKMLLHYAKEGKTSKVHELMSRGAPFSSDWLGLTPLHFSAMNKHIDTCEVLLRSGCCKNARTKVERTPLHFAVYEGHEDIVSLLLANKCDVFAKDMLQMTALHWAVEKRQTRIAEMLLENGADPYATSKFNKTPLSMAMDSGQLDLFEKMQKHSHMQTEEKVTQQATDGLMLELQQTNSINDTFADQQNSSSSSNALRPMKIDSEPPTKRLKQNPTYKTTNATFGRKVLDEDDDINLSESIVHLQNINDDKPMDTSALQLLKEHGISMIPDDSDSSNLISSALKCGRKIVLSDGGKLVLNDPKFKRVQLPSSASSTATPTRISLSQSANKTPSPTKHNHQQHVQFSKIRLDPKNGTQIATSNTSINGQTNIKKSTVILSGGKMLPLKSNKIVKVLSVGEYKEMCGANRRLESKNAMRPGTTIADRTRIFHQQQHKPPHLISKTNIKVYPSKNQISDLPRVATIKPISGTNSSSSETTTTILGRVQPSAHKVADIQSTSVPPLAALSTTTPIAVVNRNCINTNAGIQSSNVAASSYLIPVNSWAEVEKQMAELRKQLDELRKQNELSYARIEKLESQLESERRTTQLPQLSGADFEAAS